VVIRTRNYDEKFYSDMGCLDELPEKERKEKVEADTVALFGEG